MNLMDSFISLFFPRLCKICGKPLISSEDIICTSCIASLPFTDFWRYKDNPVIQKFWGQIPVENACSLIFFRKGSRSRKLIHALKYKYGTQVGYKLGYLLGVRLKESLLYSDIEVIVPIPLHPKRLKQRGYNQSEFIASGIADAMGVKMEPTAVVRTIYTSTQTKKNRLERFGNVQSIFSVVNPNKIRTKHVLVVDDIITTGATIASCAAELLASTECKVSIASIGCV